MTSRHLGRPFRCHRCCSEYNTSTDDGIADCGGSWPHRLAICVFSFGCGSTVSPYRFVGAKGIIFTGVRGLGTGRFFFSAVRLSRCFVHLRFIAVVSSSQSRRRDMFCPFFSRVAWGFYLVGCVSLREGENDSINGSPNNVDAKPSLGLVLLAICSRCCVPLLLCATTAVCRCCCLPLATPLVMPAFNGIGNIHRQCRSSTPPLTGSPMPLATIEYDRSIEIDPPFIVDWTGHHSRHFIQ